MTKTPTSDHDILITLVAEVKSLRDDIREIKDGTTLKISDHETRIRAIETSSWKKDGAVALFAFLFPILLHLLWQN